MVTGRKAGAASSPANSSWSSASALPPRLLPAFPRSACLGRGPALAGAPRLGAAEKPRDLVERPLRRREADALQGPARAGALRSPD